MLMVVLSMLQDMYMNLWLWKAKLVYKYVISPIILVVGHSRPNPNAMTYKTRILRDFVLGPLPTLKSIRVWETVIKFGEKENDDEKKNGLEVANKERNMTIYTCFPYL